MSLNSRGQPKRKTIRRKGQVPMQQNINLVLSKHRTLNVRSRSRQYVTGNGVTNDHVHLLDRLTSRFTLSVSFQLHPCPTRHSRRKPKVQKSNLHFSLTIIYFFFYYSISKCFICHFKPIVLALRILQHVPFVDVCQPSNLFTSYSTNPCPL